MVYSTFAICVQELNYGREKGAKENPRGIATRIPRDCTALPPCFFTFRKQKMRELNEERGRGVSAPYLPQVCITIVSRDARVTVRAWRGGAADARTGGLKIINV